MSVKKKIGRMIPYPAIEAGRKVIHAGFEKCAVCEGHVRHFTDFGYGFEVLERLQVVGGLRRAADVCPVCHSSSRERLIWFWLTAKGTGFHLSGSSRIAHFAPEKGLSRKLLEAAPANYAAYDIEPQRYRHLERVAYADLCKLGMADGSIDLLICNHVLEHVPDVATALSEIYRVMAAGGVAILQVPIALRIDQTIELGLDSTAEERVRLLGQDDHLRLFSHAGYLAALASAGFAVEEYRAFEDDGEAATRWRIDPFEVLFVCRKSAG